MKYLFLAIVVAVFLPLAFLPTLPLIHYQGRPEDLRALEPRTGTWEGAEQDPAAGTCTEESIGRGERSGRGISSARASAFEGLDSGIPANNAIARHIRSMTGTGRVFFRQRLIRARKYAPVVQKILSEHHLPEELVYMPVIESGYDMKARSRAEASGPWQLTSDTGERYGLRVDHWVDERRDLEKSTVAAAQYLRYLFDRFGCWYLAAAGYNAGEGRLERAIERYDTKDFWRLRKFNALPVETREYVPRLVAAAIVAKHAERYDLRIDPHSGYRPVKLTVPGGVSLERIAKGVSMEVADVRSLNPELLRGVTPPGRRTYVLKLPGGINPQEAAGRLQSELRRGRQVVSVVPHRVKRKDTIASISRRYRVTKRDIELVNGKEIDSGVREGGIVYIPRIVSVEPGAKVTPFPEPRQADAQKAS